MTVLPASSVTSILCGILAVWLLSKVVEQRRRRTQTTSLAGPPNPSLVFGASKLISDLVDAGDLYEEWSETYGSVYRVPAAFGMSKIVLCDPKAVLHFFSRETVGYVHTTMMKNATENISGRGILWAEGETHKRHRKALSPAFSNAAIRRMTSVFYDSAYKLKSAWDSIIEADLGAESAVIDVQRWMNYVSLDTIGIAGFSHDFGTLLGKPSAVAATFNDFANLKPSLLGGAMQFVVGGVFPWVLKLPTDFRKLVDRLNAGMGEIAQELLENSRKESEGEIKTEDKSIIGLLIKAEITDSELHMSSDEVLAQMKVLMLAGYETTSISLSWCLLELCKNPEVQQKLRQELSQFGSTDPTWDQLTNVLPYLDAVVHETLRLHLPLPESERVAAEDDILPLSFPLKTPGGDTVDSINIAKGEVVVVPKHMMNKSIRFWGSDAKEFKPERWLNETGIPERAQEISGHRHLLTFSDGARLCLGRHFALAEFKAVLSVIIRNYAFEFRDGPNTRTEIKRGILPRPCIAGEEGAKLPLRVHRLN
ncbi:cytochrome P450 [Fomitopsis serialis]|uniref:cytochrome P450 n=1 Tax=Fomitopsis serialis TaxID=139415 RepID=UPI002007CADD|nr:cytochrome P450 [Neoantrodia serialis]KAH9928830.1 cytochrome P450 [Neoantrodia serialis]